MACLWGRCLEQSVMPRYDEVGWKGCKMLHRSPALSNNIKDISLSVFI